MWESKQFLAVRTGAVRQRSTGEELVETVVQAKRQQIWTEFIYNWITSMIDSEEEQSEELKSRMKNEELSEELRVKNKVKKPI